MCYEPMNTLYEKLKFLPGAKRLLKPGLNFATLDIHALAMTGNQAAEQFNRERDKRFQRIRNKAACNPAPQIVQAHFTFGMCCAMRSASAGRWRRTTRRS